MRKLLKVRERGKFRSIPLIAENIDRKTGRFIIHREEKEGPYSLRIVAEIILKTGVH